MIIRRILFRQVAPVVVWSTAEFRYDLADPYAIAAAFEPGDDEFTWQIDRELLGRGLREHAGMADVRIWPDGTRLYVALSSEDGSARLSFDAGVIRRFLIATYRAVPLGRESVDVDGLIDQLLGGAR